MAVSNITIDKLRDSSDFLNLLFNNILSSVFVVTKDCRIVMVNSAFSNLLKKQEGEVLQGLCGDVIGCQHPIEEGTFCGNTTNCGKCELRNGIQYQKELDKVKLARELYIDGEKTRKYFLVTMKNIDYKGEEVKLIIVDDVTELESKNNELQEKLKRDGLTNLFNHSYLHEKLEAVLGDKSLFSLFMLDIDNFKNINDSYGHQMGDKVLKLLSEKLNMFFENNGIVGRYGGEEFMVILEGITKDAAYELAEEFRKNLSNLNFEPISRVTFSGGIADSRDSDSASSLVNIADELLYKAKRSGKNRIEI